jgi:hypothetical protein
VRFEQIRQVLGYVENLHKDIARDYSALGQRVAERRTRMLLDYMSARELALAEAVRSFTVESKEVALKEFDPFIHDDSDLRKTLAAGLQPESTAESVLELGIQVRKWFLAFYERLAERSRNPEQAALFNSLKERSQREKHKLARNANMLMDF